MRGDAAPACLSYFRAHAMMPSNGRAHTSRCNRGRPTHETHCVRLRDAKPLEAFLPAWLSAKGQFVGPSGVTRDRLAISPALGRLSHVRKM